MVALLRFTTNDGHRFALNATLTPDGQPILPSRGDWLAVSGRTYVVSQIVWYFKSDEVDEVIAYCNEITSPPKEH